MRDRLNVSLGVYYTESFCSTLPQWNILNETSRLGTTENIFELGVQHEKADSYE